jgi:hypothetical protein
MTETSLGPCPLKYNSLQGRQCLWYNVPPDRMNTDIALVTVQFHSSSLELFWVPRVGFPILGRVPLCYLSQVSSFFSSTLPDSCLSVTLIAIHMTNHDAYFILYRSIMFYFTYQCWNMLIHLKLYQDFPSSSLHHRT